MSRKAFLFLNGHYHEGDRPLTKSLIRRTVPKPLIIAVDGGLAFLQKIDCRPAYWLTDLDSAPRIKRGFLRNTRLCIYPPHKDKTDGQLAVELSLRHRISDLTFFGWYDQTFETDHLLGNLSLGLHFQRMAPSLRIQYLSHCQEALLFHDETRILAGYTGWRLSVIPLNSRITLSLRGTEYSAERLVIRQGQTIAHGNRITAGKARIKVEGTAMVIIRRQSR